MGKLRSDSERIRRARLKLNVDDRDTLLPCPACNGEGKRLVETKGRYRQWSCSWCNGTGATGALMVKAFRRWLGIANWNRLRNPCQIRSASDSI